MVLLLDADFLVGPPSWVRQLMHEHAVYHELHELLQQRLLLVLPALREHPDHVGTLNDSKALIIDVIQRTEQAMWWTTVLNDITVAAAAAAQHL